MADVDYGEAFQDEPVYRFTVKVSRSDEPDMDMILRFKHTRETMEATTWEGIARSLDSFLSKAE